MAASLAFLCLAIIGVVVAGADAEKRMKPLSAKELAQVWVGLSEDELYVLRLKLDESGKGKAAYVFADHPPRLFNVSSWTYREGQVEMTLEKSDDSPLEVPALRGSLVGSAMTLTMSGEGWSREVNLRLEAALEDRWGRLKRAMETEAP